MPLQMLHNPLLEKFFKKPSKNRGNTDRAVVVWGIAWLFFLGIGVIREVLHLEGTSDLKKLRLNKCSKGPAIICATFFMKKSGT